MRLTVDQQRHILQIVYHHLGEKGLVRVYGSQLHDDLRGGDIDLMIEGDLHLAPLDKAAMQLDLEEALQQPVDILYHQADKPLTPFQSMARAASRPLQSRPA
ncbi:MAG: nucleotidyltransferase domain-containing protein [Sinobacteraceae bacterium]|nr:nucleotidyltransferase domain-containing protein [Nevskiaceae bacterium]